MSVKIKLAVVLLVVMLSVGPTTGGEAAEQSSPELLTLNEAVEKALSQSPGAKEARLQLRESLLEAANLEHEHEMGPPRGQSISIPGPDGEMVTITLGEPSSLQKAQVEKLLPVQFAAIRSTARAAYAQQMAALRTEAVQTYYTACLAQETLKLRKESLQRLKAHRNRAESLFDRGKVAKVDVITARAQVAQERANVSSAQQQLTEALIELNALTGQPLQKQFRLEADLQITPLQNLDLHADIEEALSASAEVANAEGQVDLAEKEMELFMEHHGTFSNRRSYEKRALQVEKAEHQLHQSEQNIKAQMRILHARLAQLQDQLRSLTEHVELTEKREKTAQAQYTEGLTTLHDLLDSTLMVMEARLAHTKTAVQYRIAKENLKMLVGDAAEEYLGDYEEILSKIDELK